MSSKGQIITKVEEGGRISAKEALLLCCETPLFELASLATAVKRRKSSEKVFYNKNFHLEPTNLCRFNCRFCSYRKRKGEEGTTDMQLDEITDYISDRYREGVTEVHLVGGVHPDYTVENYIDIIKTVRKALPKEVAIKAFSAIEHIAVFEQAGLSYEEGLRRMQQAGMDTITGGGAEILDDGLRKQICPDKPMSEKWLKLHGAAHKLGMKTSATMLYGHIESLEQRIAHMEQIRDLQDKTGGFVSFIPLKYRSQNNEMSECGECSVIEDLRTVALARIFLDNIPHIKAYPPMYGTLTAQMSLLFGADDLDGTVMDTTAIYTAAGAKRADHGEERLRAMILEAGWRPVERDTCYNEIEQ